MGVEYVPDRWVEDGKFISSAGIAAGLDMALDVVGKLVGEGMARQVQLILEYDPQPPLGTIDWDQIDRNVLDPIVDGWDQRGPGREAGPHQQTGQPRKPAGIRLIRDKPKTTVRF